MNLAHMLNLDTPNLMRSINPQTDAEVALYERLYEAERSLSFYHEAINDFSELGSSDVYPELFSSSIEAIINERDNLKEALKMSIIDHVVAEIMALRESLKSAVVSSDKDNIWRKIDALNAVLDLYE